MEKVYNIRTWSCAIVILVVHFTYSAFAAMAGSLSTEALVQDLVAISRDSDDVEVRRQSILAYPASEVQNALEEMLEASGSQAIALRAIEILHLKSFDKKLRDVVRTSSSPDLVLAVNKLDRDSKTIEVYKSRLSKLAGTPKNSALKIGFLTGLAEFNESIAIDTFNKLLKDENDKVCEAAVLHLAATAKGMKTADVAVRFKTASQSKNVAVQKLAQKTQSEMARSTP